MLPCQYIAIDTLYIDELMQPETGSTVTIQEVVVCVVHEYVDCLSITTAFHSKAVTDSCFHPTLVTVLSLDKLCILDMDFAICIFMYPVKVEFVQQH